MTVTVSTTGRFEVEDAVEGVDQRPTLGSSGRNPGSVNIEVNICFSAVSKLVSNSSSSGAVAWGSP